MEDLTQNILKAYNSTQRRLSSIANNRKVLESDFVTDISLLNQRALHSPSFTNQFKDPKLLQKITNAFKEEAQRDGGVIWREMQLKNNAQNLSQEQIKRYKQENQNYFQRLDKLEKTGGYLMVGVEPVNPDNLYDFLGNIDSFRFNGTNERQKDYSMWQSMAWANNFDNTPDVKVKKGFRFVNEEGGGAESIFEQNVDVAIDSKWFKKYLHNKPYVMDDILAEKNVYRDEAGRAFYSIKGEVDSTQAESGDLLDLFISEAQPGMKTGTVWEEAGITKESSLQDQYYLGGSIRTNPEEEEDTSLQLTTFEVQDNKLKRNNLKFINTEAINRNLAYNGAVGQEVEGLFANGSGNPPILYNYAVNNIGYDLPVGFFEEATDWEKAYYEGLSPAEKAGFMGNRYKFNTIGSRNISLINSQKAWFMDKILEKNLDTKLQESTASQEPSLVKEELTTKTKKGRDIIDFLNKNNMPIPEFYSKNLGINKWQAGMNVYYQMLPKGIRNIPDKLNPELQKLLKEYT